MLRAPPVLLLLLLTALCGLARAPAARAQEPDDTVTVPVVPSRGFHLEQNYQNPPGTHFIPFYLEDGLFRNGETRVVSMRIVNMFRQPVAVPKAIGHPAGKDVAVTNLRYTEPGKKVAVWDGRDTRGRRVPSGLYYCELVVGDQIAVTRILVTSPRKRSRFFPFFRRRN